MLQGEGGAVGALQHGGAFHAVHGGVDSAQGDNLHGKGSSQTQSEAIQQIGYVEESHSTLEHAGALHWGIDSAQRANLHGRVFCVLIRPIL